MKPTSRLLGKFLTVALLVLGASALQAAPGSNAYDTQVVEKRLQPVGQVRFEGEPLPNQVQLVQADAQPAADTSADTGDKGEQVYIKHCVMCHEHGLMNAPKLGDATAWTPRLEGAKGMAAVDKLAKIAIQGMNAMPPRGACGECSDGDIHQAVRYMLTHLPAFKSLKPVAKKPVAKPAAAKASKGADTYQKYCQACHASGLAGAPKLGDEAAWTPRMEGKTGDAAIDLLTQVALKGMNAMPPKGTCMSCSDAEIRETVQYMVGHLKAFKE